MEGFIFVTRGNEGHSCRILFHILCTGRNLHRLQIIMYNFVAYTYTRIHNTRDFMCIFISCVFFSYKLLTSPSEYLYSVFSRILKCNVTKENNYLKICILDSLYTWLQIKAKHITSSYFCLYVTLYSRLFRIHE